MKVNTKDLRIADVRYYDVEHRGLEFTEPLSKIVLVNSGDTFINLLNPGDIVPIYERVPHTTNSCNMSEDYFGTKISLVSGEEKDGEAWLLTDTDMSKELGAEVVDIETVRCYVLASQDYFRDRIGIVDAMMNGKLTRKTRKRLLGIIDADLKSRETMETFFSEREEVKVKEK